ncbi:MAG: sulfite exporter TauE/SafE family protein [Deltaproteobacteria bacterium]|nr:sulfite exporter TauE/SafE family protein [Deltaproteobacteria bacterium]
MSGALLAVLAGSVVAALIKGTLGLGFPIIATPVAAHVLGVREAVVVLLLPNMLMDGVLIFRDGVPVALIRRLAVLLGSLALGIVLGSTLLAVLSPRALSLILGLLLLFYVVGSVVELPLPRDLDRPPILAVTGFCSGVSGGVANTTGPVIAVYLQVLLADKREFVTAFGLASFLGKVVQMLSAYGWHLYTPANLGFSALLVVPIMVAFWFGLRIQDRINQALFARLVHVLLLVSGVSLIYRAVA